MSSGSHPSTGQAAVPTEATTAAPTTTTEPPESVVISVVIHPKSGGSEVQPTMKRSSVGAGVVAVEGPSGSEAQIFGTNSSTPVHRGSATASISNLFSNRRPSATVNSALYPTFKGTAEEAQIVFKPAYDEIEKMLNDNLLTAFKSTEDYKNAGGVAALTDFR